MTVKGYVVRGTNARTGDRAWLASEPTGEHVTVSRETQRTVFTALAAAIQAWADAQVMCQDAIIYTVADDGTETPLPSYEEALAEIERLRATAEDVCCGFTSEGETKGALSLRINRLRVALAQKAMTA